MPRLVAITCLIAGAMALNACGRSPGPSATPTAAQASVPVEVSTAETALRAYWQQRDRERLQRQANPLQRSFESVEQESPERVVVTARVRRMMESSIIVSPTPHELIEREDARRFRYVLARQGEGWQVTEVWRVAANEPEQRLR